MQIRKRKQDGKRQLEWNLGNVCSPGVLGPGYDNGDDHVEGWRGSGSAVRIGADGGSGVPVLLYKKKESRTEGRAS